MSIDTLLLGISAVSSIYAKSHMDGIKSDFNVSVANFVTKKAESMYDHELQQAKDEVFAAKAKLGEFTSKENIELDAKLVNNPEYIEAKAAVDIAKANVQTNEAVLKTAKEDSTAIAVGSGDSSIKIKVSNETAKAKAEADLKSAKAEFKVQTQKLDKIRKSVKAEIISGRSPEYYQTSAKLNEATRKLEDIQSRVNDTRNELYDNPDIMREAAAHAGPINMPKVVGLACLESTLPVYMLYKIWHNVYEVACLQDFSAG